MNSTVDFLYVYCADFVINLANLLHLSYYEINAFIFCAAYPFLLVGLSLLLLWQKKRLSKLRDIH